MGLPGLETLLPIVYTHGVKAGRLSLEQMVQKCSTNPAKLMGLYPRKGTIAPGSDADLVLIDPDKVIKVDHAAMETNADWSPYQGWPLTGFLTPDGKPFYGGTYFPPQEQYGRPSFKRVLLSIAQAYRCSVRAASAAAATRSGRRSRPISALIFCLTDPPKRYSGPTAAAAASPTPCFS